MEYKYSKGRDYVDVLQALNVLILFCRENKNMSDAQGANLIKMEEDLEELEEDIKGE